MIALMHEARDIVNSLVCSSSHLRLDFRTTHELRYQRGFFETNQEHKIMNRGNRSGGAN
jgi:hypothetical protein